MPMSTVSVAATVVDMLAPRERRVLANHDAESHS